MTRALEQPPLVDTTTASDVAFLDVPDLLLNVASAAQLMTDRLDGLTTVDGYLLSAGIIQALEDSLYGYPLPLRSAVRRLSRSGRTRLAGLAEPAAARAWSARARLPSVARTERWKQRLQLELPALAAAVVRAEPLDGGLRARLRSILERARSAPVSARGAALPSGMLPEVRSGACGPRTTRRPLRAQVSGRGDPPRRRRRPHQRQPPCSTARRGAHAARLPRRALVDAATWAVLARACATTRD